MDSDQEMLEIIDERDTVIGIDTRKKVHQEGLLHREIHIWFITPAGEIIFQHRAKDKDTYPDKLDATVGGHVDPGMSYEETAVKECKEETGIDIDLDKLIFITKIRGKNFDEVTGCTNNSIRSQYAYLYSGKIEDLKIEKGKSVGFESWKIDSLKDLKDSDREKFVPAILSDEVLFLFQKAKELLGI